MKIKAKITVIVPIYNVEKYISKCLESLIEQKFQDFVVFAISDGSTDSSMDIVKKYSKKDQRIIPWIKENGGYGSVLEYAIKRVKTEYFLICDPDDWLSKDALDVLYKFSSSNKLDLLIADKYKVYVNEESKEYIKSFNNIKEIEPKKIYTTDEEIQSFAFGESSPHAKLFRTSIAKNIKFPHKVSYTDTILYAISLMNCQRIAYYNKGLAYYLIDRPGNSMTEKSIKKLNDNIVVIDSIFNQVLDHANKTNVILYYIYSLTIQLLNEFSEYPKKLISKNYKKKIIFLLNKLLPYKQYIYTEISVKESERRKMIFKGLMNRKTQNKVITLYLLYMGLK